jgi:phosphoesterase RecJ-like protein
MKERTKERAEQTDLLEVLAALTSHDRFLVVSHENPDGDALGSMLAMALGLRALGKDALMYLSGTARIPAEFEFMDLAEVLRELPADVDDRALVAVDCANARRIGPDPAILDHAKVVIDIDHHHDNARFGSANLIVADASSTAEIIRDLLWELGVSLQPAIAEALYVGLVTDTGRFQYSNTTPKAFRLAAELVEAGADVHGIFRSVYETVQFAKLKLLARALDRAQLYEGGRLLVSHLLRSDFEEVGAEELYSEGIIDFLRQAEGAQMVALIREPPGDGGPKRRVSLRSSQDEVDVSAVAGKAGGGGHRQAAGFSSELSIDEISDFIRGEFVAWTGGLRVADAAASE